MGVCVCEGGQVCMLGEGGGARISAGSGGGPISKIIIQADPVLAQFSPSSRPGLAQFSF